MRTHFCLKSCLFFCTFSLSSFILANTNDDSYHHFAFASYLGSGIYHASGQNTTVFNIPISFELKKEKSKTITLRTPISLGFFNFDVKDIPNKGIPHNIGTTTIIPGIVYKHKKSDSFTYQSYIDLGYGKNFASGNQVAIFSTGASSTVKFNTKHTDPIWVTRFYFAGYSNFDGKEDNSFSSIQSGIDIGFNKYWHSNLLQTEMQPRIFTAAYLYFDKLKFIAPFNQKAILSNSIEIGASLAFSKPILWEWMGITRLGLSYRVGSNVSAWRLVFDFPI